MWYPQFKYTFKASDEKYIENLVKFYPYSSIEDFSINGVKDKAYAGKEFKDLQSILNESKLKQNQDLDQLEISIITEKVSASSTTWQVFPKFVPQYISQDAQMKYATDVKEIKRWLLDNTYLRKEPGVLPNIANLDDAWKVLDALYQKIEFRSAINCPSIGCILLFSPNWAYAISYNKEQNKICDFQYPAFDIDEGFIPSPYGFIPDEMKMAFEAWKKNGSQGPVFPELERPLSSNNTNNVVETNVVSNGFFADKKEKEHAKDETNSCVLQ